MLEATSRVQPHDADSDDRSAGSGASAPADAEPLAELRRLLVGPEQHDLASLHRRLDDPDARAADLAEILPDAICRRERPDRRLAKALAPAVEDAVRDSIRKNPQELADAISPALGPAIRRAIRDALQRMVGSVQQIINNSLSVQSFKWRFEAWRTGKPFGEIVLARTLVYRVEQVFLIHRETGLLLLHAVAPGVGTADADMVSGMLTAIRDFVRDSFAAAGGESLDQLQMGELVVWVETGPRAYIAAVIRGMAPDADTLRDTLKDALDTIHVEQAADLEEFAARGEPSAFEPSRPVLEQCLVHVARWDRDAGPPGVARRAVNKALRVGVPLAAAVGLVVGVTAFVVATRNGRREQRQWEAFLNSLRAEPGYVVTEAGRAGGRYAVAGLRDPLAADPAAIAGAAGLDPARLDARWEPYHALHAEFIRRRAEVLLAPPPGVRLTFDETAGVLRAEGEAPGRWIRDARRLARALPGVSALDTAKLSDSDLSRLAGLREAVERAEVRFVPGSIALAGPQDAALDELADRAAVLIEAAREAGLTMRVEVIAAAAAARDGATAAEDPVALARRRAEGVRRALIARGLGPTALAVGEPIGGEDAADVVHFKVVPPADPSH